ncbi:hypothetical protein PHJA_001884300 [Phtheirospermum japonicum]|uniref:Secreted protein n=1 Tax=Phtheirospermum japonicum TaxID=374723 RepID=A0A830CGJ4_9LAMI|nr:hypothetical protein PHJA_001884300 [Phtheirospermum japonicum]
MCCRVLVSLYRIWATCWGRPMTSLAFLLQRCRLLQASWGLSWFVSRSTRLSSEASFGRSRIMMLSDPGLGKRVIMANTRRLTVCLITRIRV